MRWWKKKPQNTTQRSGQQAELRALEYLHAEGLMHVESNFRRPFGEIDLIMQEHATLVFVEVRSRAKSRFGGSAVSITLDKQKRLILVAEAYLQRYQVSPPCRFDVIAIDDGSIEWLKNVIEA